MASSAGTPTPSVKSSRTRCPGAFGAIIETSMIDGRLDLLEVDVEAVREHQGLALAEVRQKRLAVDLPLTLIGGEHHHHVG